MEEIEGEVFSGFEQGAFFTQLDWVKRQCSDRLGFEPFPGTLNLTIEERYLGILKRMRERVGISLEPPTPEFCPAKCFPISISSIKAAIILPQAEHFTNQTHKQNVIEVIAPVSIKEAFSLKDGDKIAVKLMKR